MHTLLKLILFLAIVASSSAATKPNIIIIFIDDMGYGDVGAFNPSALQKTPNLDRMASEGMKLTSFYAAPVCSVSRAQLLTGCYGARISVPGVYMPNSSEGLNPNEKTIADYLKDLGYSSMCIGKWHVGDQAEFLPTKQGFDGYFGIPYSNDMWGKSSEKNNKVHPLIRNDKVEELITDDKQHLLVEQYTEEAVRFITANKDKPFFLYLPHNAIHTPIYPGKKFEGKSTNNRIGDLIQEVDASTGKILETLTKLGIEKNTLVIFTSDNGPWLIKEKDSGSSGSLRGGKGSSWEGSVRVPTIAWWPGKITPASSVDAITGTIDLLPTTVSLAGGSLSSEAVNDGKDISCILFGKSSESPRGVHYYFMQYNIQAVREGPWKLALSPQNLSMGLPIPEDAGIQEPRLYNLNDDISETTNVAEKHPEIVARLTVLAKKKTDEIGGQTPTSRRPAGKVEKVEPLYK